ncbi:MAG: response regulator [Dehalococcoidales bacterium]|nr:response regulator [Dehalococcoidales bacterium]
MLRQNPVDLLLLDLQLPEADGWEVLRRIRNQMTATGLSIVILTASAAAYKSEEAFNLGAAAYLVKPVNIADLISTVGNILKKNQRIEESPCRHERPVC